MIRGTGIKASIILTDNKGNTQSEVDFGTCNVGEKGNSKYSGIWLSTPHSSLLFLL